MTKQQKLLYFEVDSNFPKIFSNACIYIFDTYYRKIDILKFKTYIS